MDYYRIIIDDKEGWHVYIDEHWPDGSEIGVWPHECKRYDIDTLPATLVQAGKPIDYCLGPIRQSVISERMGRIITEFDPESVQLIPVTLDAPGNWYAMNILNLVDCLDHERSDIRLYYPDPFPESPHLSGTPRDLRRLIIDTGRADQHHLLRVKGWEVSEIISKPLRDAFIDAGLTGMEYWPVTE